MIAALNREVAAAMSDESTAAVVIAGEGPTFCSGADLRYMLGLARHGGDPREFLSTVTACFSHIERAGKPVVAAVHGHVVAGGLELALACDVVVAMAGTVMGDGHVRNGLVPGGGASLRLPRKVGEPLARWLMLTGELLPAEAFVPSGMVHTMAPPETFEQAVGVVVGQLAQTGATLHGRMKYLLQPWNELTTENALNRELDVFSEHWRQSDVTSGLTRFVNRNGKE